MKKTVFSAILLVMALLLGSCDKLGDTDFSVNMDVNVEGYVFDGITEMPIKGAVISGSFGEKKTNSDGYYSIKGIDMGDYRIEVAVEGYMTMVLLENFQEKEEDFKGDEYNELLITGMYKADQPISTQLVKVLGPTVQFLPNLPYTIELNGNFLKPFVYGKTDARGELTDTIPDGGFSILVDTVIDGIEYSFSRSFNAPNSLVSAYQVTLTDLSVKSLFLESTNLVDEDGNQVADFDQSASIELVFNEAVDVVESVFTLEKQGFYDVKTDVTFSQGNKKVTIKASNGKFEKGGSYTLYYAVQMEDDENSTSSTQLSFNVEGDVISSLATPEKFKLKDNITDFTSQIDFEMQIDNNSTLIEVYGRYVNDEDFVKFSEQTCNWSDKSYGIVYYNSLWLSNLPNIVPPAAGMFSDNHDFEIMVRTAVLSNGEWVYSEFSDVITLKEGMVIDTLL